MANNPIRPSSLPEDPLGIYQPLFPTMVIASYKGGVWKTSLAVSIAERLSWAGAAVLLLTCDTQEDARARLGVQPTEPMAARRQYGAGSITVVGIRGSKAVDMLYRVGPQGFGLPGPFDIAMVDTPPEMQAVRLPGVLLIAPTDGRDATRNLVTALRRTPANTDIILVRVGRADPDEWARHVDTITQALGRAVDHLAEPLPREAAIQEAHDSGQSVWTLPRRGGTQRFLSNIDALAKVAWDRFLPGQRWPTMPPASSSRPYVPGWDDYE